MSTIDKVTRLDWIAKAGFVARGVVYILFGWLAFSARSKVEDGKNGVFDAVRDMHAGNALLALLGIGLLAYGVYRLTCAFLDTEGKGSDPKGLGGRAAQLGSGIVHLTLAYTAFQFMGAKPADSAVGGGDSGREASKTLLTHDFGGTGLWILALVLFAAAGWQFYKAFKAKHMKHLMPDAPPFTKTIGRIGLATRGIVFAVIAMSFVKVAQTSNADQAKSTGTAIASLYDTPWLYTFVAIGLILFGVFSLIQAQYRVVPAIDVADAARGKARQARAKLSR